MSLKRRRSSSERKIPDVYGVTKRRLSVDDSTNKNEEKKDEENVPWPDLPSETEANLSILRRFYEVNISDPKIPPILLCTQLYALSSSRTTTDIELNDLIQSGKIRIFQIVSHQDERALLLSEDFLNLIEKVKLQFKAAGKGISVFDAFASKVVPVKTDVFIQKSALQELLGEFNCENIPTLVQAGILLQKDASSYYFGIPDCAPVYKAVRNARKKISFLLQREKFKELLEKELLEKNISKISPFGVEFHIRDMIGKDIIRRRETTAGNLISFHENLYSD